MDANDLIGLASKSRFLRADDVGDGVSLTIAGVSVESMRGEGGDDKDKGVVWFEEEPRGLVLNVTLTVILRDLFGVQLEGWAGKRITLFNDRSVRRGNKVVGGIRIKGSPDIAEDRIIIAGKSAFSKGTQYRIRAEKRTDPLLEAFHATGITVEAFNAWAAQNDRAPFSEMAADTKGQAAQWIRKGGYRSILAAVEKSRPSSGEDFEDPMAV